jgi:ribosomal protein S18 acetylase RimI-like enzyme
MVSSDLEAIVRIHLESFPGFFLTCLGQDFLKLLYRSIHCDRAGVVLVAVVNGQVEGFVAGVTQQRTFYQLLIRTQLWAFASAALGAVLRQPAIAPRLLRALQRPAEAGKAAAEASLMSVAVRPSSEGQGIGRQLVLAFCQALAARGVESVCLTTDRDQNARVNLFYQQLGFRLSRSYVTPEGRAMNEYVRPVV